MALTCSRLLKILAASACVLLLALVVWLVVRLTGDTPVTYANDEDNFKYGSTGGERDAGIPLSIWKALPELFPEYLPGKGYESLGLIYEAGHELPIGVSKRRFQGIDRVFVNCAVCHTGSVRDTPASKPRIIVGMPSNTVDLEGFENFLFACAVDQRFTAGDIVPAVARAGTEDWFNRLLFRAVAVNLMRERLLTLRQLFQSFTDREPAFGPGRVDTFNPPKVLLGFRMDLVPEREWVGICDFPSIWRQGQREGMWLHWDGNNNSVEERNRSAAFGTGAIPPTLDRPNMKRIANWLRDEAKSPPYPYPVDQALASRGEPLYQRYCADCHGKNGTDFSGKYVGQVTPIEQVKTDRRRLDSYSLELCGNQNLLYAGGEPGERFSHFRKTFGYANAPLDGVWLRAPYLHNGSVPTLRELLEPADQRRAEFYRGYDVYDQKRVGFVADVAEENGRPYFHYLTSVNGNSNAGHEGEAYGTTLPPEDKDAIVEFLKTF